MTERDILHNYATNRCDKQIVEVKHHLTQIKHYADTIIHEYFYAVQSCRKCLPGSCMVGLKLDGQTNIVQFANFSRQFANSAQPAILILLLQYLQNSANSSIDLLQRTLAETIAKVYSIRHKMHSQLVLFQLAVQLLGRITEADGAFGTFTYFAVAYPRLRIKYSLLIAAVAFVKQLFEGIMPHMRQLISQEAVSQLGFKRLNSNNHQNCLCSLIIQAEQPSCIQCTVNVLFNITLQNYQTQLADLWVYLDLNIFDSKSSHQPCFFISPKCEIGKQITNKSKCDAQYKLDSCRFAFELVSLGFENQRFFEPLETFQSSEGLHAQSRHGYQATKKRELKNSYK